MLAVVVVMVVGGPSNVRVVGFDGSQKRIWFVLCIHQYVLD